jgi:hypothetical protein
MRLTDFGGKRRNKLPTDYGTKTRGKPTFPALAPDLCVFGLVRLDTKAWPLRQRLATG